MKSASIVTNVFSIFNKTYASAILGGWQFGLSNDLKGAQASEMMICTEQIFF